MPQTPQKEALLPQISHSQPMGFFYPDLLRHIGTFLPAYALVGTNSYNNVCKAVKRGTYVESGLKIAPTVDEVMRSCQTPQDALIILSDPSICDQLSFHQLLTVVGAHPQIVRDLLSQIGESAKFTYEELEKTR